MVVDFHQHLRTKLPHLGRQSLLPEQIQFARRYYNGTARDMNILVQSFPSNLIARSFSFNEADYFEIELTNEREAPKVQF